MIVVIQLPCNQSIRVQDTSVPVINCPNPVTIECNASTDPANTGGSATAMDVCSGMLTAGNAYQPCR